MSSTDSQNWNFIKTEILDSLKVLLEFAKNPVQGMKSLPEWKWSKLLFLVGGFAAVCGVLTGLVNRSILGIFSGVVVYPISTLLSIAIFSGLFYYIFMFFFKRELSYQKIFTNMTFALLPALTISTLSGLIPPITLVGTALTGLLLIVGFVDNFRLPKKKVTKLICGLFLIYVIIWITSTISFQQKSEEFRYKHKPENLDILQKELGP